MIIKNFLFAIAFVLFLPTIASAQSGCAAIAPGAVLTAGQWNLCFSQKQDQLGFTPLNQAGGTMTGELITAASSSFSAGLNCPQGTAPSMPRNGDVWCTSAGMFVQISGVTVGPFGAGGGGGGGTPGGTNGQVQFNNAGAFGGLTNTQLTADINIATASLSGAVPAWPNNSNAFFNGAGSYTTIPCGGLPALVGNVTTSLASCTTAIAANAVSNAMLAQMNADTIKCNNTGGAATPIDCTVTQLSAILTSGTKIAALDAADQTVSGGANVTSFSLATGSATIDCGKSPLQYITGAATPWAFTAPANDGSCIVMLTNPATSVNIPTFTGFTVSSNTGSPLTNTASAKFSLSIWRINGTSGYSVFAHQ